MTWKSFFRRKPTFLSELDSSDAVAHNCHGNNKKNTVNKKNSQIKRFAYI